MSALMKPDPQHGSKYEGDDLKRVLFIFPDDTVALLEKQISKELQSIAENLQAADTMKVLNKAFYLTNFAKFMQKYPLVCLTPSSDQKNEVLAMSRFPSEIKQDKIFLGNMINILSKDYA